MFSHNRNRKLKIHMKKNMKSESNTVGRPKTALKYPRGSFTIAELAKLNPNVCMLTCRKHVDEGVGSKTLKLLKETVQTGKVGKPAYKYIRSAVWKGLKSARNQRGAKVATPVAPQETAVTTEPQVPTTPAPLIAQEPVSVEIPLNTPVVVTLAPAVEAPAPAVVAETEAVPV